MIYAILSRRLCLCVVYLIEMVLLDLFPEKNQYFSMENKYHIPLQADRILAQIVA